MLVVVIVVYARLAKKSNTRTTRTSQRYVPGARSAGLLSRALQPLARDRAARYGGET